MGIVIFGTERSSPLRAIHSAVLIRNKDLDTARAVVQQVTVRHARIVELIEYSTESLKSLSPRLAAVEKEMSEATHALHAALSRLSAASSCNFDSVYEAIDDALAALDESPEARDGLRLTLQRYVNKVYLYGRDGLANVLFKGSTEPHLITASDTGLAINVGPGKEARGVRLPLPR